MLLARRKRPAISRLLKLCSLFFLIFLAASLFSPLPSAKAAEWAGWNGISVIYYDTAQEDANNTFLATAAQELQTYLGQMAGRSFTITHSYPPAPAIYIIVNPDHPSLISSNDESFNLVLNSNGVTITGKTALACQHGAYDLLERLGVRWFFKDDAWTVVPDTLIDLGTLNITDGPDWIFRLIWSPGSVGTDDMQLWSMRNRLYGTGYYFLGHSYGSIAAQDIAIGTTNDAIRNAYWDEHPQLFLPVPPDADYWPWQLNPANPTVIDWATQYVETQMALPPRVQGFCPYVVDQLAVPVSPNDGGGFNPPYSDYQAVTDLVFGLVKAVAENVAQEYPDKYVSCYAYAQYSMVPTFSLPPNILVEVATNYNYGSLTFEEQIAGYKAKGVLVGMREYLDIWTWYQDINCMYSLNALNRIKNAGNIGVTVFNGESGDGWCARTGLTNYIASKLLWDKNASIDATVGDFYNKAFGPAAQTIENYWSIRDTTTSALTQSYSLLNDAETEAAGDEAILERIRQLQYYNRFLWKFPNISSMSLNDLKDFYTFLCKIRDLYIVFYRYDEAAVRAELLNRGLTSAEITALQNFNPPTAAEARAMMDEALAFFGISEHQPPVLNPIGNKSIGEGQPLTFTVSATDLDSLTLTYTASNLPLGASFNTVTHTFSWTPNTGQAGTYANVQFVVSDGSLTDTENITITVTDTPSEATEIGDSAISRTDGVYSGGYTFLSLNNPASSDFTLDTIKFHAIAPITGLRVGVFYQVSGNTYRCRESVTVGAAPAGYNEMSGYNIQVKTGDVIGFIFTSGGLAMDQAGGSVGVRYISRESIDQNDEANFSDFLPGKIISLCGSGPFSGPSINADVNEDGHVNILDLIRIIQHWGETGANGWIPDDVNQDGVINILDFNSVVSRWS